MSMHSRLLLLVPLLFILAIKPAHAQWRYLVPGGSDKNIHRAFVFANESDDRLELACNSKRIDFFYITKKTVSKSELKKIKAGKPTILVRFEDKGLVGLNAHEVYQKGGRLTFFTGVIPAFVKALGKAPDKFVAGLRADGKIVRQGLFSADRIKNAMRGLASGCGF